ncbi:cyclic nucleotide-binding domain-containing protein [Anoxynatronum buryatiense]|uniref:cAMP-binding domain of CRP or a regulatory subunit of cAMP-dependent protein kinases n=1 Tax=Anoxynatronum buryatiense TaxID=489973 RepID=A0AA45WVL7_9CLOT|nr:cyclic nucleotide-binding domain-containing protein [Anoxynatronum buryatiense]SMP52326.1 cAMP-binding domain of CRP or a regulatory subunit of cAMP-dependent protein kinases [Anoxynatronum buryatiense]
MMRIENEDLLADFQQQYQVQALFSSGECPEMELFAFQKGDILLEEGMPSKHLFFLVAGAVKIATYSTTGKVLQLSHLEAFQVIGEMAVLWEREATANVQATKPGYCLALSLEKHRQQLLNDVVFLRYVCHRLSEKMTDHNQVFSHTIFEPLENRLAALILQRAANQVVRPVLTEWAELLCTSYRHLLRSLSALCAEGAIEKQGRQYRVKDEVMLGKIASGEGRAEPHVKQ